MNNKINYNDKYILIVNNKNNFDIFKYSFKNIMILKNDKKDLLKVSRFIKQNNFEHLIFVNYENIYLQLINSLEKEQSIKVIFTKDLGTFSNRDNFELFSKIYELYKDGIINEIGFLDKALYDTFKEKIKASYIILDREEEKKLVFHDNTISIINDEKNVYHSYYNSLSAISLTGKELKIKKVNKTTNNFIKTFKINTSKEKNKTEKSILNLYINFTDNDNLEIIKSFDNDTICIVGNTTLFDGNNYLKNKLVLKSDDDINEIKNKIEDALVCKDKIMNEYSKFRKEYSNNSRKSILNFINDNEVRKKNDEEYLISVILPVYNAEEYLENTIKSIIKALVRNMELIIINDGSTDNSESIILKYKDKYPKIIKYYSKKNEGLGSVRNLGLKYAKGKYISSVDSDDQIDKNFYRDAIKYLNNDVDMVIYDWMTIDKNLKYPTPAIEPIFKNKSVYEGILYTTIMPSQCNKIIKKSLYEDLKITYSNGKYEDFSTNSITLLNVKKFKYIKKPYYKYYIRQGSIMRSSPKYDMIDAIKLLDERLLKYKEYITINVNEYKYYLYAWRIEDFIINILYDLDEKERNKMIDYAMKNIKDIMLTIFESSQYKEMLNRQPKSKKEYILERNKSIKNDKFKNFLSKTIKEKSYEKLTGVEILYI